LKLVDGIKERNIAAQGGEGTKQDGLIALRRKSSREFRRACDFNLPFPPILWNSLEVAVTRENGGG
jgi:hypothetical protein